jgi:hypothetical protein
MRPDRVSHSPGADGVPVCRVKTGTVIYGADPTCTLCRRAIGLPVARVRARKSSWIGLSPRSKPARRIHALATEALRASGGRPVPMYDLASDPTVSRETVREACMRLVAAHAMVIADRLAAKTETVVNPRTGKAYTRTRRVMIAHIIETAPIPERVRSNPRLPSSSVLASTATDLAARLTQLASPEWTLREDLFAQLTAAGYSLALCRQAQHQAVKLGWLESTRVGGMGCRVHVRATGRYTVLPPAAKPKRVATPGAKARPPRLSLDVSGPERVAPDPVDAAPVIVVTERPFAATSARTIDGGRGGDVAPVRSVDVGRLLDDDLAAALRAMMG